MFSNISLIFSCVCWQNEDPSQWKLSLNLPVYNNIIIIVFHSTKLASKKHFWNMLQSWNGFLHFNFHLPDIPNFLWFGAMLCGYCFLFSLRSIKSLYRANLCLWGDTVHSPSPRHLRAGSSTLCTWSSCWGPVVACTSGCPLPSASRYPDSLPVLTRTELQIYTELPFTQHHMAWAWFSSKRF